MPNSHQNSKLMRVQKETAAKIHAIAEVERRADNAQLAVIVDEWIAFKGMTIDVTSATDIRPAHTTTAPRR